MLSVTLDNDYSTPADILFNINIQYKTIQLKCKPI